MLLTAAGKMPPPIKIPKRYKSIEFNRMKRQVASGDFSHHYRHAIEIGVRLAMGFEWLSQGLIPHNDSSTTDSNVKSLQELGEMTFSTEKRILEYHTRVDLEAGGNGEWIRKAWAVGPNLTRPEDNISSLVKCPVWYPEITKGGIAPIRYPGKTVITHIRETLQKIRKEEFTSNGILKEFPRPRIHDVDSDSWVDMDSIDAFENKMNNTVRNGTSQTKMRDEVLMGTHNIDKNKNKNQSHGSDNIEAVLNGLQSFIKNDSGAEGVVMGTNGDAPYPGTKSHRTQGHGPKSVSDKIQINCRVFIDTLYNSMSEHSAMKINTEDDNDLLQYFSRADLEDGEIQQRTTEIEDGSVKMHDLMNTMDEELAQHKLDINDVDITQDHFDCDERHLSPNDPIAQELDILSNLMKSLEVQGGSSGPVTTILDEMGIVKPDCA